MQFFILVIVNIFIGAVLYLVISLKLERSATEFREKKFRKEMDAVIKEFNSTAERNISILENRITLLRRLLDRAGEFKTLDVIVGETEEYNNEYESNLSLKSSLKDRKKDSFKDENITDDNKDIDYTHSVNIKKELILLYEKIKNIFNFKKIITIDKNLGNDNSDIYNSQSEMSAGLSGDRLEEDKNIDIIIEKDLSSVVPDDDRTEMDNTTPLSEEDIASILSSAEDKYSIVSILSDNGCTVEDISKHSGIPLGEVRLVLNLNRSR